MIELLGGGALLAKLGGLLVVIAGFFGYLFKVKHDAKKEVRQKLAVAEAEAKVERVHDRVAINEELAASDAAVRDQLRRHTRPPSRS